LHNIMIYNTIHDNAETVTRSYRCNEAKSYATLTKDIPNP